MTIQVRVLSAGAMAQLRALEMQQKKTAMSTRAIGQSAAWGLPFLSKWGNQVQWAGRQLMYNFTLPIGIAGVAATKWALENEKAMVRVEKVYGDGSKAFNRLSQTEIPALTQAFEALSNQFGVAQAEVIGIAGDWAAAGASGIALAKSVKLTLETMVLGEISAAEATKNLIAIQAQYGQSTTQLTKTIDVLNMVENQTGTTMKDLMDSMARSAGVARVAGVDVEHLAAMTAALVPAAGSAANAGNALKTIISRILSPTEDAVLLLKEMGIEMDSAAWTSSTATDRIEELSKKFIGLSDAQKVHMSTVLGSRWQLNRLVILMQAVNNQNSYYNKSLRGTADAQAIFTQRQKELNEVLTSNPQMMKQAWVILQNAMTKVIVPLIPYIVYLAQELARLATWFANLEGDVQKMALAGLIFIAVIGPIARYVGSVSNLVGLLSAAFHFLGGKALLAATGVFKLGAALLFLPVKAAIGSVMMLMGAFGALATFLIQSFSRVVFGAALVSPLKFAMLLMVGTVKAGLVAIARLFMASGFVTAIRATWIVAMTQIRIIWTAGLLILGPIYTAVMGTLVSITAIARARLVAIWAATWAALTSGMLTFRAAMITIWLALQTSLTTIMVAGSVAIRTVWMALSGSMVAISAVTKATLLAIWSSFVSVIWGVFMGIAAAARALPMLIFRGMMMLPVLLMRMIPILFGVLMSPWGLAIAAILGLVYAFRNQIGDAWGSIVDAARAVPGMMADFFSPMAGFFNGLVQGIVDAFWALPEGVRNAMVAVLTIVRDAALAIYDWFSYINPFARHSPSLVENVEGGMDAITSQFARLKSTGGVFQKAYRNLNAYKKAMGGLGEFADDRKNVAKSGGNVQLFDAMTRDLNKLYPMMRRQESAVANQERVTDRWANKLDEAADRLSRLQQQYDQWTNQLEAYADAPLKGMGQMQEQIDANTNAQNKLNLEIMKWEQANGSIDSMRDRLAALYGDIEMLSGRANDLRMQGAGSDVLGPINDQIRAMEAQASAVGNTVNNSPVSAMQDQLAELQRAGEMLQLQYDVKFDPLTQQIDRLANTTKELSFEEIVAGMQEARTYINRLQGPLDAAQATHDRLQSKYDAEKEKLDELNESYSKTSDVVADLESALRSMGSAGSDALAKLDGGKKAGDAFKKAKSLSGAGGGGRELANSVKTFRAGEGGNWPDPGSFKKIGREGGMGDQSDLIKQFAERSASKMAGIFGGFDMFGPIKEWWKKTWDWIKANLGPIGKSIMAGIGRAVEWIVQMFNKIPWDKVKNKGQAVWNPISNAIKKVWGWGKKLWDLFGEDVIDIWNELVKAGKRIWSEIGPELAKFGPILKKLPVFFKKIWEMVKPLVQILGGALLIAFKLVANVISQTIGPVLDFIIDIFYSIVQVIRGAIGIIVGVVTGDWKMAWEGLKSIVAGVFNGIWAVIKGFVRIIWGVVSGLVEGIVDFFKWLFDVLVGNSIIPDLVKKIWSIFKGLLKLGKWIWDNVLKPIIRWAVQLTVAVIKKFREWWPKIKAVWNVLKALGKYVWDKYLKPVWNKIVDLGKAAFKELAKWWERVKNVWNKLRQLGKWWWDNIGEPVWNRIKSLWDRVREELNKWWERIKNVWNNLKGLGQWVKEKVMDPVFDKIRAGWEKVRDWLQNSKDMLTNPVQGIVNAVIGGVNKLISGLNKISGALPGINFSIGLIPKFATGGPIPSRRVGGGFKTNGARAIVGEGKANWPEYVIPTDPTYRKRARGLLAQAAAKLGPGGGFGHADSKRGYMGQMMNGVPAYGLGGIIGDFAKSAWEKIEDLPSGVANVASFLFKPFKEKAMSMIGAAGDWPITNGIGRYGVNKVMEWVGMADAATETAMKKAEEKYGKGFKVPSQPGVRNSWKGGTFTRLFIAAMKAAEGNGSINVMQGGFRPATGYSGTSHRGDAVDMQVDYGIGKRLRQVGIASGDRTGMGDWAPHIHAIPGPDAGQAAGSAVWQWSDYVRRGGINQSMTSPWGLAEGALVKASRYGSLARIGEGNRDELVTPLPRGWRNGELFQKRVGDGETHLHFHGDLSFPNITSGNDAEALVNNLTLLAKD